MTVHHLPLSTTPLATRTRADRRLHLAFDFTALGARPAAPGGGRGGSPEVALVDIAQYLELAEVAGADYVTFGAGFRLGGASRSDSWLDPAVVSSRLARSGWVGRRSPGLVPALRSGLIDPLRLAAAVHDIHRRTGGRAGWEVEHARGASGAVLAEVRRVWTDRGGDAPVLVAPVSSESEIAAVGAFADVARLRVRDLEVAREWRGRLRAAAVAAGRAADEIRVLVDLEVVIGVDEASAQIRADLVADLAAQSGSDNGQLRFAGTAAGFADLAEDWLGRGAADGFTVTPGSLPADVYAVAHQVAPLLVERGLLPGANEATLRERLVGTATGAAGAAARDAAAGERAVRTAGHHHDARTARVAVTRGGDARRAAPRRAAARRAVSA